MSRVLPRVVAAIVLALVVAPMAPAQAQSSELAVLIREISFRADGKTDVVVSLSGSAVGDALTGSNFSVTEAGQPVAGLTAEPLFSARDTSVAVALVFDNSGSIRGAPLTAAKNAAKVLLGSLPPGTKVALFTLGGGSRLVADFTTTTAPVSAAIDSIEARGRTFLFDAIVSASQALARQGNAQRNVVILSDGRDSQSTATLERATSALRSAGAPATTVLLAGSSTDANVLQAVSQAVQGGRFFSVADPQLLQSAFATVAQSIRTQYVLTYPATATTPRDLDIGVSVNVGSATATDRSSVVNERKLAAPGLKPADQSGPLVPAFGGDLGLFFGIFAAFAALMLFVGMLLYRPAGARAEQLLARGLRLYTKAAQKKKPTPESGGLLASSMGRKAVGLVERVPRTQKFEKMMQLQLEAAGWPLRSTEFILIQIGGIFVGGILGFGLFARWWLGVLLMVVGALAPRIMLSVQSSKRNAAFLEQLPDTLQLLAGSLQAGYGFMQALDTVAKETPAPTGSEFSRVLAESRLGMPLEEALDAMAERVGGEDFKWVVLAINIQRQVGGNLATLLHTVSNTLREREQVRRQIKVLSAEGRLSAVILVVLPFLLVGYLEIVNPKYLSALTGETIGKIAIAGALVLIGIGIVWMRKIIKIDV